MALVPQDKAALLFEKRSKNFGSMAHALSYITRYKQNQAAARRRVGEVKRNPPVVSTRNVV
jgi:hypothetical protein